MAVTIETVVVGPIATNCYVVKNDITHEAFVIDPGIECDPVLAALAGYTLKDILLTHAHFDHMGGAARLVETSGANIWVHTKEADWLSSPVRNLSALAGMGVHITAPPASVLLQGGETKQLLGQQLQIVRTPGHTPGHVIYHYNGAAFVGDLIFRESVGRTDFPGGSFTALQQSIKSAILSLPADTRLLPGHGEETTVGYETTHNPYLRY